MTKIQLTPDMKANNEHVECWHLLGPIEGAVGINAVAAWQKSRGKDINVGIVDTGVELTHPSLAANISTNQACDFDYSLDGKGRLIQEGGRIANPFDAHGTACAGIVGAVEDREDTDVVGVAPECSLVPVRINANFEPAALEAALEYAASVSHVILLPRYLPRAASVAEAEAGLSEREKKREEGLRSLERTLRRIATEIPVVCAAGNDGKEGLVFPACLPETISVAACNGKGWRSTYSQYGENLDVVAPSNDVPIETKGFVRLDKDEVEGRVRNVQERGQLRAGQPIQARPYIERKVEDTALAKDGNLAEFGERAIATTDNLGDAGYNFDGNYCKADGAFGFGGTSAAAAQVAGVVALMLAANPNLMGDVKAIRERLRAAAAVSMKYLHSNGDPHAEFGYGLIDAKEAVG